MDAVPQSSQRSGFFAEWFAALAGIAENPVAGWLLTARERRTQKLSFLRKMILPLLIGLICAVSFIYAQRNNTLIVDTQPLELVMVLITVSVIPAVLIWALTGVFSAVVEALSLLADDARSSSALTIDDMVSVSHMSSADIAVGALQVIMPQLFWRALAVTLSFWWIMLMLTSMFGTDLRSESFINTWIWGIVTVPLMLLGSLMAALAMVLGCIAVGLHARGTLAPLTSAALVMTGTLAWFFVGGTLLIKDEYVVQLTKLDSMYGAIGFLLLAFLIALLVRRPGGRKTALAVLMPMIAGICIFAYFRLMPQYEHQLPEVLVGAVSGFLRSWGNFSLINPLFVPTPASWGDVFLRNPVTGEGAFLASLEMRWLTGFLTQAGLVWINAWLAWQCIVRKRSNA